MKNTNRSIMSVVLAVAMVFTSVSGFSKSASQNVKAGTTDVDITGVTVESNIVENGDAQLINALTQKTMSIDGVTYNNYSRYTGVSASASTEIKGALNAIDGKTGTRWESNHGVDPQELVIDLGNTYSIKALAIYWETASAKEYKVEVSADGENFKELTDIESKIGGRTDMLKLSKAISVRTVKINCLSRNTIYGDSIYELGIFGSETQKDVVSVLSNLKVRDYYKYTGKYMIYFNEAEESSGYNVYIDNTDTKIKTIKSTGSYLTAKDIKGLSAGNHTLYVANTDATGKESAMLHTTFNVGDQEGTFTDVPQVYIYTDKSISKDYHANPDVTVSIVDKKGGTYKDITDGECNIKVRGNSTAGAAKKPWNIKLSGKKSVLGMDKGKKWCLLANSFDKSLMRNSLVYDLGLQNGVTYSSQSRFVDVYINGTYNGNYLMTEPVEAKTGRVEIDAYNSTNNDILLELGTRNEQGVDHFQTPKLGITFDVNDPEKGDDLTDAEVDAKIQRARAFLGDFETALSKNNYDEILKYMDEDTFVNFYIASELFKNVDFNFSSTRFYIKGSKVYAGPLWDFDLSSGNCKPEYYREYYVDGVSYKGYYCQGMNWYKKLFKNETFYSKVKQRYKELQYVIQNMYKTDSETTLSINYLADQYGASFERNYKDKNNLGAGWSLTDDDGYSYTSTAHWTNWKQPIEFLRDWLKNRNAWLCERWGINMNSAYEESKPGHGEEPTTVAPPTTVKPTTAAPTTVAPTTAKPTTVAPTTVKSTTVAPTAKPTDKPTVEPSVKPTTEEPTTKDGVVETTVEPTSEQSSEETIATTRNETTGNNIATTKDKGKLTTTASVATNINVPKTKISKATKKAKSVKIKILFKKVANAKKYEVKVSSSKKFAKKKTITKIVTKTKANLKAKKFKNAKKLYVKVRAIYYVDGKKYCAAWSSKKRVKVK